MKFQRPRAFYIGSASWLLLCAATHSAMAEDAPAAPSTQLPEVTVTAPSPIQRHRAVVPTRAPARVARSVPAIVSVRHRHSRRRRPLLPRPSRAYCRL